MKSVSHSVVFDSVIGATPLVLGALLVDWGVAGTFGDLFTGRLVDRLGARKVLLTVITVSAIAIVSLAWTGANFWTVGVAIATWSAFAWSVKVPQQSRLVSLAPKCALVALGLNNAATHLGVTVTGIIGALDIETVGARNLGIVGALLALSTLAACQLTTRLKKPQGCVTT